METKELKIIPPEEYVVDRENSTFECIKFKPKELTYKDIAKKLFVNKDIYFITLHGSTGVTYSTDEFTATRYNNAVSEKQVLKLLALNKLINVAKYLNGDWKPDFEDNYRGKYYIYLYNDNTRIGNCHNVNFGAPCFKTEALAKQAIEILGEETIKLALSQV